MDRTFTLCCEGVAEDGAERGRDGSADRSRDIAAREGYERKGERGERKTRDRDTENKRKCNT